MKKNKLILILMLIFFIAFLLAIKLLETNKTRTPFIPSVPTPTQIFAPSPTVRTSISPLVKSRLIKKLPVVTTRYTIQYLDKSDTFLAIILLGPYQRYKKEAILWFTQNGIEDLTTLNVQWDTIPGVSQP